jgi:hypothetical protein
MANYQRNHRDAGATGVFSTTPGVDGTFMPRATSYLTGGIALPTTSKGKIPCPGQSTESRTAEESWFQIAKRRLEKVRRYPDNWDSYGAAAPSPWTYYYANEALLILNRQNFPMPQIAASVEEGIGISYRNSNKTATIEFLNSREIVAVRSDGTGNPHAWQVAPNEKDIESALESMHQFLYA